MTNRATVAVAKDDGMTERPRQTFSMNLNQRQLVIGIVGQIIAMLAVAVGAASWVGNVVIEREFGKQIKAFHEIAKPDIQDMVDAKIEHHHKLANEMYHEDQEGLRGELATLKEHARLTDSRLQRIEDMLWAIYTKELGTNRLPPRSPNGH